MNQNLQIISNKIRYKLVEISHLAQSSHLGGALSCVDILTIAYWNTLNISKENINNINRDRFIMSKGHAISSLYVTLAYKGILSIDELKNYNKIGSNLPEQPSPNCVNGVEWATGSLGHGLSVGVGMAIAGKNKYNFNVLVLLSDGECQEGSVWEAAMFAPKHKLNNLMVIIDYNKWQATGRSNSTMQMEPLSKKWESFGWETFEVNGHSLDELKQNMFFNKKSDKPKAIIANTIKGKGISFMEDDNNWHYRSPSKEELYIAKQELGIE